MNEPTIEEMAHAYCAKLEYQYMSSKYLSYNNEVKITFLYNHSSQLKIHTVKIKYDALYNAWIEGRI